MHQYSCALANNHSEIFTMPSFWYAGQLPFCHTHHAVPIITVNVGASITSPTGFLTAGQSYTLTCTANVTGEETLFTTITWIHPNGSVTPGTGSSLDLSLSQLQVSDAGQYTCNVSVSSPFLNRAQNSTDTYTVIVQGKLLQLFPSYS